MELSITLGLFYPLITAVILLFFANKLGRSLTGWIACLGVFASFVTFASVLFLKGYPACFKLYDWVHLGAVNSDFSLCLDSVSLLMTLVITGVGFLIHVYSTGYMDHDEHFGRYFACLNFFVFSMLLLVLAADLLLLFVGWEGVGVASYLLIGFWYEKKEAYEAAVKAFVVNRIGDLGLLLGILLTYYLFNTGNMEAISAKAGKEFAIGAPIMTLLTLLYFIGAMGKSAQIPLQTWLPDAMSGPTPVSALIHAATMVTAGVYLIVRMSPVFVLAPQTLMWVGIIGAVTSLYAAGCAIAQTDLKRVLAYSTISQLGLMFMACGAGAFYSAMFHLTTHAFVKALLFLTAGSVLHGLHGETQMSKMGGLSKVFPLTGWLFLLGSLALAGIPPFATFFSKDLILEQEYLSNHKLLFYVALLASILTAFYMMRAYLLTFRGELKEENKNAKEMPWIMNGPVVILALLATFGGLLGFTFQSMPMLEEFLAKLGLTHAEQELDSGFVITPETWMAVGGAFLGVGVAWFLFKVGKLQKYYKSFKEGFYIDDFYENGIVQPLKAFSTSISHYFEPNVIDGGVTLVSSAVFEGSSILQKLQSGQVRSYIAWMALGMVFLMGYLIF